MKTLMSEQFIKKKCSYIEKEKCKEGCFQKVTKALTKTILEFKFYLATSVCQ